MMKRIALMLASCVMIFAWTAVPTRTQAPTNIVVIQIDDMDVTTVQQALAKGLMPNLKKYFVDKGVYFPNSFVDGSLGGVSRAGTLMGQHPQNHHEIGSNALLGDYAKFNEASTVAVWTHNAGYLTLNDGRYIPGWGFTGSWYPSLYNPPYVPPGWDYWTAPVDHTTWSVTDYTLYVNGTVINFAPLNAQTGNAYHQVDMLGYVAFDAIGKLPAMARPFMFWFAPVAYNREMLTIPPYNVCPDPTAPNYAYFGGPYWGVSQRPANRHIRTVWNNNLINGKALAQASYPMPMPPSFNEADISDKPAWLQTYSPAPMTASNIDCAQKRYWRRLELLRTVDDSIGGIMGKLEVTGLLANTLVFFTADNGMGDGQHRFPEKGTAFEESIRVPLWVYTPWNTQPRTVNEMVMNIDIAPTIAEITGAVPTHDPDGRSLLPLLNGVFPPWRQALYFQHSNSEMGNQAAGDFHMVRTDRWKYVKYDPVPATGVAGELYDLQTDPYEMQNLWLGPYSTKKAELDAWLTAFKTCAGITCRQVEIGPPQ